MTLPSVGKRTMLTEKLDKRRTKMKSEAFLVLSRQSWLLAAARTTGFRGGSTCPCIHQEIRIASYGMRAHLLSE